ncbi:hypothetical protein IV203_030897 [Nitzschia inconspicua]|uniref:Uncharacterized protein n=1 Tax=Nitzschia inconspicua TaxID=303405 RepID=A0A9K3LUB3_9STRA|nr:hypothetical protein IV203_030897 [Nitzschia inconspicua]
MSAISMATLFFTATTTPLSDSGVTSTSTLFIPLWNNLNGAPNDVVCFVGKADGLETDVASFYGGGGEQCQAANGCGVHVHAGTDCTSTETQLGHWYNNATLSSDPWAIIGYTKTDSNGHGEFANCIRTGYDLTADPSLLDGRAFIVHSEDGSRTSCGLIEKKDDVELAVFVAETTPIAGSTPPMGNTGVKSLVSVLSILADEDGVSDGVCYQGYAMSLEPDVESFLLGTGSIQCDIANGCGTHIHNGTGCETTEGQGGHYYDSGELSVDPWLVESYYTTDSSGSGAFVGCVLTGSGATKYENRPFVVHGTDGSRLSCGILNRTTEVDMTNPSSSAQVVSCTISIVTSVVLSSISFLIS